MWWAVFGTAASSLKGWHLAGMSLPSVTPSHPTIMHASIGRKSVLLSPNQILDVLPVGLMLISWNESHHLRDGAPGFGEQQCSS